MQKARRHFISKLRPLVSVWFQVLFHPLIQGTFHLSLTVLVHYRSLRSIQPYRMVPAVSNGISPVPPYSGYHSYYNLTCKGLSPAMASLPRLFQFNYFYWIVVLQPQYCRNNTGLGSSLFARHYLGNHQFIFSSSSYLDVSVHRVRHHYWSIYLQYIRLPHSDIYGSNLLSRSPQLFAAWHVFLRL